MVMSVLVVTFLAFSLLHGFVRQRCDPVLLFVVSDIKNENQFSRFMPNPTGNHEVFCVSAALDLMDILK